MSSYSPGNKVAGIKQAWADPKARTGLIFATLVLVAIAILTFTLFTRDRTKVVQAPGTAAVVPPPSGQRDVTADTTEQYKKLVNDSDRERSSAANASPTSVVMPTLSGLTSDDEANRRKADAEAAAERGRLAALNQGKTMQQEQFNTSAQAAGVTNGQQGASPAELARNTPEYKTTMAFLSGVVAGNVQGALQPVRPPAASSAAAPGATAQAQMGGGSAAGAAPAVGAAAAQNPIIRVGEIVFGTSDLAINTDYNGPVTATVRQGPFSGYRMIGQKQLENYMIVVRFNLMSPPNGGAAMPINAYAVSLGDATTFGLTALEGETDHHVFQRYILPAAVAFTQTYGLSANSKGSTTTTSGSGAVGTETPALTSKDRLQVAAGAAMGPLLSDVVKRASRPVTVRLLAGAEFGILFASDVLPGGQLGAGSSPLVQAGAQAPGSYQQPGTMMGQPMQVFQPQQRTAYPMQQGQGTYQAPGTFQAPVYSQSGAPQY